MTRRAVFLDRDGVLNRSRVVDGMPLPPNGIEDLEIIPSAADACRHLHDAGFALVVVTNQPDVARGTLTMESVDVINDAIAAAMPIDAVEVCPHDDADNCDCRKPKPGMLLRASSRLGVDLRRSFMVGDRWRDIEAGRNAGCTTVFVNRGYTERQPESPDIIVGDLAEALPMLINADAEPDREVRSNA